MSKSNQQILEKATKKAIDNGWEGGKSIDTADLIPILNNDPFMLPIKGLIFNHDFAKALWGERDYKRLSNGEPYEVIKGWQDHLQKMVIAKDPIEYLGENL